MTPVLVGRVDPLLYRLREPLAEGQGYHSPYQLGNLREEALHLDHLLGGGWLLPARLVFWHTIGGRLGAGFETTNQFRAQPLLVLRSSKSGHMLPWCREKGAPPTIFH